MRRAGGLIVLAGLLAGCGAPPVEHASSPEPPAQPAPAAPRSFADFRPSLHGFAFRNDFRGSPLPFDLGPAEKKMGLPNHYGLCGGMSCAAADYFLASRPVPELATPPEHGTALYTYLFVRQQESFGALHAAALRFVEWMHVPDDGPDGTRARTAPELPAIESALERGQPVILGLVLVSAKETREPWLNHQVLAYGARREGETLILSIYDPNFPKRDDVVIRVGQRDGLPWCAREVPGRQPMRIRGMFRMPYSPADPTASMP
jgi:hypothetical protein